MDFRTDKLLHGGDYNPEQWLKRPDILENLNFRRIACNKKSRDIPRISQTDSGAFPPRRPSSFPLRPSSSPSRRSSCYIHCAPQGNYDRLRGKKLRTSGDKALFARKKAGFQPYY